MSVILAGGLLVALSIPALGMQFKEAGMEGLSRSTPIIQTLDRIDAAFPGGSLPASVVVKAADVTAPEVQRVELVPAEAPALAAEVPARAADGGRTGIVVSPARRSCRVSRPPSATILVA